MKKILLFALLATFFAAGGYAQTVDPFQVPYISAYYFNPIVTPTDEVIINFYISDWFQSEYRFDDDSKLFDVTLKYALDTTGSTVSTVTLTDASAGDNSMSLGTLSAGKYWFSLQVADKSGRKSNVLFYELLVRTAPQVNAYTMTQADLTKYGISNAGNNYSTQVVELSDIGLTVAQFNAAPTAQVVVDAIAAKVAQVTPASGQYVNVTVGVDGAPVAYASRTCKVVYATDYNAAAVATAATATLAGINQMLADCKADGYNKIIMLPGTYRISHTDSINVPTEFSVDLNGAVIKLNGFTGDHAMMIQMVDCYDSHVFNGIVEGDYLEHDYAGSPNNSEWVCGVAIYGASKYCSYTDLETRYITGYGVTNGFRDNFAYPVAVGNFVAGQLDKTTGQVVAAPDRVFTSGFVNVSAFVPSKYVYVARYLGYQGIVGDSWNITVGFYDANQNFLEAIEAFQYRLIRIPQNSAYIKVTAQGADATTLASLSAQHPKVPSYCTFKDITIKLARCVGMAPAAMRNFLIQACDFSNSGETSATCAFDAEDGWDTMQDTFIKNNVFHDNPRNELLTTAGHNFQFEGNSCAIYLYPRTKGYVVRNNTFKTAYFGTGTRVVSLLNRVYNNTFTGNVSFGNETTNPSDGWTCVMTGTFQGPFIQCGKGAWLRNMTLSSMQGRILNAYNCTLTNVELTVAGFTGCAFIKCTMTNITGHTNGAVTIDDCDITNVTSNINNPCDVNMTNSRLTNFQYNGNYWTKPSKINIDNCTVSNAANNLTFIRIPAYTIDDVEISETSINCGSAPVVNIYDIRAQDTDTQTGTIRFTDTTITGTSPYLIVYSNVGTSVKTLLFYVDSSNTLPAGMEIIKTAGLPATWQVNPVSK